MKPEATSPLILPAGLPPDRGAAPRLPHAGGTDGLVELSADHPGFNDADYRQRRNQIARLALEYQPEQPVPDVEYTPAEHGVWQEVWAHLGPLHEKRASREYLRMSEVVPLPRDHIPQLREVNAMLLPLHGFTMLPVAGLVAEANFLSHLCRGVFLSTQYMRHHSMPLYTPEPDVIHELVGHAATFGHEALVRLNRAFGAAVQKAADPNTVHRVARLYWYTLEFGLVAEDGDVKAYGAGLLSSFGELEQFPQRAELRPLNVAEMAATPYDPTSYQRVLYVASSFPTMVQSLLDWLEHEPTSAKKNEPPLAKKNEPPLAKKI